MITNGVDSKFIIKKVINKRFFITRNGAMKNQERGKITNSAIIVILDRTKLTENLVLALQWIFYSKLKVSHTLIDVVRNEI